MGSRGQATVEHVGLAVVVAAVVLGLGALLVRTGLAEAVALAVARAVGVADEPAPPAPERVVRPETLRLAVSAVRGDAIAYSVAGARSLLAEELGDEEAARVLDGLLLAEFHRSHPEWFATRQLPHEFPRVGREPVRRMFSVGLGAATTHVVTPADEAEAGLEGERGGWRAVLASLAEAAIEEVAGRVVRGGGIAIEVASIVQAADVDALAYAPAGERAGDVVVCRRHAIAVNQEGVGTVVHWQGVRVAVLRHGRLVRDTLVERPTCG